MRFLLKNTVKHSVRVLEEIDLNRRRPSLIATVQSDLEASNLRPDAKEFVICYLDYIINNQMLKVMPFKDIIKKLAELHSANHKAKFSQIDPAEFTYHVNEALIDMLHLVREIDMALDNFSIPAIISDESVSLLATEAEKYEMRYVPVDEPRTRAVFLYFNAPTIEYMVSQRMTPNRVAGIFRVSSGGESIIGYEAMPKGARIFKDMYTHRNLHKDIIKAETLRSIYCFDNACQPVVISPRYNSVNATQAKRDIVGYHTLVPNDTRELLPKTGLGGLTNTVLLRHRSEYYDIQDRTHVLDSDLAYRAFLDSMKMNISEDMMVTQLNRVPIRNIINEKIIRLKKAQNPAQVLMVEALVDKSKEDLLIYES